jgi:hypothetical protein
MSGSHSYSKLKTASPWVEAERFFAYLFSNHDRTTQFSGTKGIASILPCCPSMSIELSTKRHPCYNAHRKSAVREHDALEQIRFKSVGHSEKQTKKPLYTWRG